MAPFLPLHEVTSVLHMKFPALPTIPSIADSSWGAGATGAGVHTEVLTPDGAPAQREASAGHPAAPSSLVHSLQCTQVGKQEAELSMTIT